VRTHEKPRMARIVPPGKKGVADVTHFTIDERAAAHSRVRQAATRGREQAVEVGAYAMLRVRGQLMMTDTQMEWDTMDQLLWNARGDVLVGGLGLGMCVTAILQPAGVTSVTVVELEQDVIDLVVPHLQNVPGADKLSVFRGDVRTWKPKDPAQRFDTIWLDIWPTISRDNERDMEELRARFRPLRRRRSRLHPWGSWLGCWSEDELR